MKKGIEAYVDYDINSRWKLIIEKKRGKLSLDEIKESAREHELDYYLLVLDCYHDDEDGSQYSFDAADSSGDRVELYRSSSLNDIGD
ncbi:MAG: hypothetical protein HFE63_10815 [Clostridiales bacterium]|nr:hypothetical protein [Clostridiales bacterium]